MADSADCEVRDSWLFAQDVNAWSSLAYAAVGAVALAVVAARRSVSRAFLAFGALAVLEGVGSMLYHGGSGDLAQYFHDVPLVGLVGFIAGWHVGRLRPGSDAGPAALIGLLVGIAGGAAVSAAGLTSAVAGVLGAVIVIAEVVARRRRLTAVWNLPLVVLTAIAGFTWVAGRGDTALCDGTSLFQWHGVWHVLSALLLLAWFDRALEATGAQRAPRLFRGATDLVLGGLTKVLTHAFYRSVEVVGRDRIPRGRPVLVVANHGNGLVDPIVVASVLGRVPRFLAKSTLWKVPVARPLLAMAGVLPVYRASDGSSTANNRSVFAACHRELARHGTVAIFPEGTTHDAAAMERLKTGAARIALGALPVAPDLVLVPIGIAYESRIETRSRAVIMIGAPIEPHADHPLGDDDEPERSDATTLTDEITDALEAVSPEFATLEEREALRAAAGTRLRVESHGGSVSFGDTEVLARRIAAAPPAARADVLAAFRIYASRLHLIGVNDRQLAAERVPVHRIVGSVLALLLMGSAVVAGTIIHLPALLLVIIAAGAVRATVTKGTVRILVGLVAGLATWIVAGIVLADGFAAVVVGVLVAVLGAVALLVWQPLTALVAMVWGRLRVRDRAGLLRPAIDARAALVTAVDAAVRDDAVSLLPKDVP